jgi:hypothetical protein
MPPLRFEPTIPASARLQTYALERAVTGIGENKLWNTQLLDELWTVVLLNKECYETDCSFPTPIHWVKFLDK